MGAPAGRFADGKPVSHPVNPVAQRSPLGAPLASRSAPPARGRPFAMEAPAHRPLVPSARALGGENLDGLGTLGWMGFLATRVAPSRLVGLAALRAVRSARNRIAPPLAPSRDDILSALGCGDARGLAGLLARPAPRPVPWTAAALSRALERHAPGERERALARAAAAASGRIAVFGREVDVSRAGGGTDWQLDPIHGGRFAGTARSDELPPAPGLDPKMAWAIGRGEHWVALACGAVLDARGGEELARALDEGVRDFVAANPVGRGIHWTCAMEVALRAWHLLVARWVVSARGGVPEPGHALDLVRLFVSSGRFILAHLEDDSAVPNNHLVTDWLGLLACAAALPEWPEAPRWRGLAMEGLRRTIAEQVHAEGTSFEGSLPYQRFSLELFAAGALLAHATGRGLGRGYARRLAGLFASTRALLSRSGELPQIGDNDSGRVLAFRQRGPTEGGYLLPLGASLLRDPRLLVRPGAGDAAEVAFLFGPPGRGARASPRPGSTSSGAERSRPSSPAARTASAGSAATPTTTSSPWSCTSPAGSWSATRGTRSTRCTRTSGTRSAPRAHTPP